MTKTFLPDELILPGGAILKPVIGGHLNGKRFNPEDNRAMAENDGTATFFEHRHNNAAIAEAKRQGLKYRKLGVLGRRLRGKNDLHGRPYTANTYIFVEVTP